MRAVKKRKKILSVSVIICILLYTLSGCGTARFLEKGQSNGDSKDIGAQDDTRKDVVFLNEIVDLAQDAEYPQSNQLYSYFTKEKDDHVLYAYRIELYYAGSDEYPFDYPRQEDYAVSGDYLRACLDYKTDKAVSLMKQAGLYVLTDYPYCRYGKEESDEAGTKPLCAAAGSWEDIEQMMAGQPLDNWYVIATSAPRPDVYRGSGEQVILRWKVE